MVETYQKASGSAGSKGVDFQINLISIFLLTALRNFKDWKLSTENKLAGKFDDVVFESPDGSAILLQAKHKQNKRVTLNQLFSTNSKHEDFSLPKYFLSYLDVRTKFPVKSIILCTNTQAEAKIFEFLNPNNVDNRDMLFYEDITSFYSFNDSILPSLLKRTNEYYENIVNNKDIDETLITEENAKEFLNHLQLYLDYPSGNELEKTIEKSLSELHCFGNLSHNVTHRDLHLKIKHWFEQPGSEYLTESRSKAMFCEIKSEKHRELLEDYKIFFNSNNDLAFMDSDKKILHIVSEGGYLLHLIRIFRNLQDKHIKILYADCVDGKMVQKEVIRAFELPLYTHLVIVEPEFSEIALNEISNLLKNILKNRQYKRIIFVAKHDNKLAQIMKCKVNNYEIFSKSLSLADLSEDTQEKLLKKRNIVFQGADVSLEELFSYPDVDMKKSITSNLLEKLIRGATITVGKKLIGLKEELSKFYVNRTFKKLTREVVRENRRAKKRKGIISEKHIYNVPEKVILVSNSAGTGKTTVLTNLALKIKTNNPGLWVIKIELNNCTQILNNSLRNNQKIHLWQLLNDKDVTNPMNDLEAIVFTLEKKIVLMLDGLDEISPDYTNLILDLLLQSQKAENISKIILTTRPHMTKDLETHLNVTSFGLVPLTEPNQIDLLTNYWTHSLKLDSAKHQKCKRYAKTLINRVSSWIMTNWYSDRNNPFIACPLQARMLAEVFLDNKGKEEWQGCREYLSGDAEEPKLPERIDIARLYEMFIDHKRDIFVQKGNPSGNSTANQALRDQFEEYLVYHRSLALQTILNEKHRPLFSCYRQDTKNKETIALKMGIVQKLGYKLCFIHRTFAEYFVAESLLKEIQLRNGDVKFEKFLIDEVFLNAEFDVVRHFFNNFLQKLVHSLPSDFLQNSLHHNHKETLNSKLPPPILFIYRLFSRTFCSSPSESRLLKRQNSYTAMHKLAMGGNTEIIRLILKCTNLQTTKAPLPRTSTLNSFQYLVKRDVINLRDEKGETPLHQAVIGGHLDTVKFLVSMGANVGTNSESGGTALHLAFKWNKLDIAEYFLAIGVDINTSDTAGRSSLHSAVLRGKRNIVEFLVERGADVNMADRRGRSALFFVDSSSVTEYLLDHKANVNFRDKRGCTSLHLASLKGGRSIVQILLKYGVNVGARDTRGRTALHFAVLGFIWNALKFLLEHGMNVNAVDNKGLTVLHLAAQRGSFDIVEFLVQKGADVNAADKKGRTALDFAGMGYYRDVTEFFRDYCPEMHVVTEEGWPLIVEFLVKRGGRSTFFRKNKTIGSRRSSFSGKSLKLVSAKIQGVP